MKIPHPKNYIPLIQRNEEQQTHQVHYDYRVSFEINDFNFDPQLITEHTGLTPKISQKVGDYLKFRNRNIKQFSVNRWMYQMEVGADLDIEERIVELCDRLEPHKDYLLEILHDAHCHFSISGYSHHPSGQTGIHFSKNTLALIHKYDPEYVDVDIYYRSSMKGLIPYWFDRLYDRINTRYIKANIKPKD